MSYQKLIIVGNLGGEPTMRYMPDGVPVTNFNLATNRHWSNPDGSKAVEVTWFRVTCWRKTAEIAAQYLSKGREVMVEGRLTPDRATGGPKVFTKQDGTSGASYEVTADRLVLLGSKQDNDSQSAPAPSRNKPAAQNNPYDDGENHVPDDSDDDIPF